MRSPDVILTITAYSNGERSSIEAYAFEGNYVVSVQQTVYSVFWQVRPRRASHSFSSLFFFFCDVCAVLLPQHDHELTDRWCSARNQLGRRIFLPHRLDRGTSGCLLLGFSSEAVKVRRIAIASRRRAGGSSGKGGERIPDCLVDTLSNNMRP